MEFQMGMRTFNGNWTRGHPYFTLAKKLFMVCLGRLCEAKLKYGRLTDLVEEILKYLSLWPVAQVLLAVFSQIYSKNQEGTSQENEELAASPERMCLKSCLATLHMYSSLSCHRNKMPNPCNLRKERFIWAHSFSGISLGLSASMQK